MAKPRIGVLGLGIMGRGIALNYLQNEYDVVVWNRTPEKTVELVTAGAVAVTSPADVCENSDYVFDVTASDESSRFVFADEKFGILTRATSEKVLITCATLSIDWVNELSQMCKERELTFFDMPMTGSRAGAESGNLSLLVGGDIYKFEEVEPHLKAISNSTTFFGDAGSGMKFKLVLNAIQAAHVIAFGEAMRQVKGAGIDVNIAGNFLAEKPGGSPTRLSWNAFQEPLEEPNFSVKWILKDLQYAKKMLDQSSIEINVDPTILETSISVLQRAFDAGDGDRDWTIVNN